MTKRNWLYRGALYKVFLTSSLFVFIISSVFGWQDNGVVICNASDSQGFPKITSNDSGGAIIVWQDRRSGSAYDIYTQKVDVSGAVQWTFNGVVLCDTTNHQEEPNLISDGSGGAIIVWEDYRNEPQYDVYAQRVNSSGTALWQKNGVVLCGSSDHQLSPQLISDGFGGAIIVWEDRRSGSNYDIYAQRINSSGDTLWQKNGVLICNVSYDQRRPRIVSDGSGGAIIVWEDWRNYTDWNIYAQRVNASGTRLWNPSGVDINSATDDQLSPRIIADGSGGAIITWYGWRDASYNIYAQRIDSTGARHWPTFLGAVVCNASGNQTTPAIVASGTSGAIISWADLRGVGPDIYAQKVDSGGNSLWESNGIEICDATDTQQFSRIVSDNSNGAIIIWGDYRSGSSYDIYAQRVDSSGVVQWDSNGVVICNASNDQKETDIISDGSGNAIITWQDIRISDWNIYAQRVFGNGAVRNPDIQVSDTSHDFGDVVVSDSVDWTFIITNIGDDTLVVDSVLSDNPVFYLLSPSFPQNILPSNSIVPSIGFAPADTGAYSVTLMVYSNDYDEEIVPISLTGRGVAPDIALSDTEHDFGDVLVDSSEDWIFHITNEGTFDLVVDSIISTELQFTIILTKSDTIVPNDSLHVTVRFLPTSDDSAQGTLFIYSDDPDEGTLSVTLKGKGAYIGFEETAMFPNRFFITQNSPNPFVHQTAIQYGLPRKSRIRITIYNLLGQRVTTLVDKTQEPGYYAVHWDGRNSKGSLLGSGIYFYKFETQGFAMTKKLYLVR